MTPALHVQRTGRADAACRHVLAFDPGAIECLVTHSTIASRIAGPPSLAGVVRLARPRMRLSALTTPAQNLRPAQVDADHRRSLSLPCHDDRSDPLIESSGKIFPPFDRILYPIKGRFRNARGPLYLEVGREAPVWNRVEQSNRLVHDHFTAAPLEKAVQAHPDLVTTPVEAGLIGDVSHIIIGKLEHARIPVRRSPLDLLAEHREELARNTNDRHVANRHGLHPGFPDLALPWRRTLRMARNVSITDRAAFGSGIRLVQ